MGFDRRVKGEAGWESLRARLACAGLVLLAASGAARAADTLDEFDADDLLARAPEIEETRSFYLRGDIGFAFNESADLGAAGHAPLGDAGTFGLGAGLRLNDMLRLDLTADYRSAADARFRGWSGDASAVTLLANAYLDLGTWQGVTPYIGAGLGAAHVSLSGIGAGEGWGFAWAAMAGGTVSLAPNWQVDLGYRYVRIENAELGGGFSGFSQAAHEVRLGLRYLFD
ncbi:outer membrane protein [Ancylobacter sp. IITR112]|uniref:outer membrane protein n=1 Tax=Ancylobacter sp. IITR112 TaxID=3138073 RepID=UPI00352A40FA